MDKEQQCFLFWKVQHVPVSHYKKAETILRVQERIRWTRKVIGFSWFILFCCSTVCWLCGWLPSWSGPLCKRDLWHYLNFLGQVWRKHGHLDQQRFKQELMYNMKSWVPTPLSVMKQPQGLAWTGLTSKRVLVVKQWALHIQQMTPGACVAKTEISEAGSWLGSCDQTVSSVSEL